MPWAESKQVLERLKKEGGSMGKTSVRKTGIGRRQIRKKARKTPTLEHYQLWIGLPRAWITTLLKQCWIKLIKTGIKVSQHPKKSSCPSKILEKFS